MGTVNRDSYGETSHSDSYDAEMNSLTTVAPLKSWPTGWIPAGARIAVLVCQCLFMPPLMATSAADTEAKLTRLKQTIAALNADLNQDLLSRDSVTRELRRKEQGVGKIITALRAIDRQLVAKRELLGNLRREQSESRAQLRARRFILAAQIRTAYALGRKDQLQILLNQDDPSLFSRALAYHHYFAKARATQVRSLQAQLERLSEVGTRIDAETSALEHLQAEQTRQLAELERESRAREVLLQKLSARIVTREQRLERLGEDQRKLEQLLTRIATEFEAIPVITEDLESFADQRARLSWPIDGDVRHRFGTPREGGYLTWQGVLLAASPGQRVHTIFHGRVAFAEWLRGFGLLMIIDHGDGYMSLYGHNQALFKELGDWVATGEMIATVGSSGGRSQSGLYFEVRYQGAPKNPSVWCKLPASTTNALVSP